MEDTIIIIIEEFQYSSIEELSKIIMHYWEIFKGLRIETFKTPKAELFKLFKIYKVFKILRIVAF